MVGRASLPLDEALDERGLANATSPPEHEECTARPGKVVVDDGEFSIPADKLHGSLHIQGKVYPDSDNLPTSYCERGSVLRFFFKSNIECILDEAR